MDEGCGDRGRGREIEGGRWTEQGERDRGRRREIEGGRWTEGGREGQREEEKDRGKEMDRAGGEGDKVSLPHDHIRGATNVNTGLLPENKHILQQYEHEDFVTSHISPVRAEAEP